MQIYAREIKVNNVRIDHSFLTGTERYSPKSIVFSMEEALTDW